MLQATMTGALARVVGTTLALWLPLVPLYLFVRHAISSRSPSRWVFSETHLDTSPHRAGRSYTAHPSRCDKHSQVPGSAYRVTTLHPV